MPLHLSRLIKGKKSQIDHAGIKQTLPHENAGENQLNLPFV